MTKKIILGVVLLALAGGGVYWWHNRSAQTGSELVLNGNVDIRQVSLAFDLSGRVDKVLAEEGDKVQAGQVLATLDTESLRLQAADAEALIQVQKDNLARLQNGARPQEITQAKNRVAAAQAQAQQAKNRITAAQVQAANAKNELVRLQNLARDTDGRGTSKQELDAASSAYKVAQAQADELGQVLKSAQAQIDEQTQALKLLQAGTRKEDIGAAQAQLKSYQAKLDLLNHQIAQGELKSPSNGVVRSRLLEAGDMASPQKAVFALALTEPKWVRAYVSETDLGKIHEGMTAQVSTDSDPNQPISGTVGYISSVAEFTPKSVQTTELRSSLVYEIRVTVKDPSNRLRLGQPATVKIDTAKGQ